MKTRNRGVAAVFMTIIIGIGMVPQPLSAASAKGTFTVNDETVQFTHAYALNEPNEAVEQIKVVVSEYSEFYTLTQPNESPEDILVIVANMPLPEEKVKTIRLE